MSGASSGKRRKLSRNFLSTSSQEQRYFERGTKQRSWRDPLETGITNRRSISSELILQLLNIRYFNSLAAMFSDSSPNATSLFTIVVSFLLFNTVGALIRMREDIRAVTFTISFSVLLLVFFASVSAFEKLPQDSKNKKRLKIPIWLLSTTLNSMFAYRVWTIIQPGMALGWLVWGMGGTSSLVTFYFFFLYTDKKSRSEECDSMALCAEQV